MKTASLTAAILVIVAFSPIAIGAPKPANESPICHAIQSTIDNAEMDASDAAADEITEDSAPRAAVQEAKVSAAYLQVQANLLLMSQQHCPPRGEPISTIWYLTNAMTCKADMLKVSIAEKSDLPASCSRANWKRAGK